MYEIADKPLPSTVETLESLDNNREGEPDVVAEKPYCYFCEVASEPDHPNEYRDKMMQFISRYIDELEPELLCAGVERYHANMILPYLLAGDDRRPFLRKTVWDHLTRHQINQRFQANRDIRDLMELEDAYNRTSWRKDTMGNALPPHEKNTLTRLKVTQLKHQLMSHLSKRR